jgi:hypothetical protein
MEPQKRGGVIKPDVTKHRSENVECLSMCVECLEKVMVNLVKHRQKYGLLINIPNIMLGDGVLVGIIQNKIEKNYIVLSY